MSKTPHPARAAGCTPKQIEAFERISTGESPYSAKFRVSQKTLDALVSKGLVLKIKSSSSWPAPPRYEVPVAIHSQWCQWCDENISDEEMGNV